MTDRTNDGKTHRHDNGEGSSRARRRRRRAQADMAPKAGAPYRDEDYDDAESAARRAGGRDSEGRNLGRRIRRYAEVGRSVGGLAAQIVGNRYLGVELDSAQHSSELKAALGGIKGPLMKAAQILATIPDALPREYAQELQQLQSNAPPMGWPFVKRRMTSELGPGWRKRFKEFSHEAVAAASLGQVHLAVDDRDRKLACKLQYPDMQSAVDADLQQLRWVLSIYRRYDNAIDTSDVYQELSDRLREELDYGLESRHMALYGRMLADENGVHVPEPVPDLSTRRLLTMTWVDGMRLMEFVDHHADQEERNRVAYNMFRAWYVPFYYYGVIHGDPHLGNYTVRADDQSINLMDFGCIRTFRPKFVKGVIDLYWALENGDEELARHAYATWGFVNLNAEVLEVLNLWARYLYGPLLEDAVRPIQDDNSPAYGAELANKIHKELKRLGGVKPPREFVLMDRAAIGLGSVFMHLKAQMNWHRMFHDMIRDFDADALAKRQKEALEASGVPLPA
ncbi:ABC1 kinase family protein [Ferruginivarius sediminum]|nr:AarF/ABC1/UbiB kinase family protein [Ferruginivarius sediminum]